MGEELVLAFDTATDGASIALVADGALLGERDTRAVSLLADADALLDRCGRAREDVAAIAVGVGPGSYTGLRMGLVTAKVLSFALGVPVAGVSTLATLGAGAPGALPVLDARRGEVFTVGPDGEPLCLAPDEVSCAALTCVGDGAVRYRDVLESKGATVPAADDPRHRVRASLVAALAREYGPADAVEPVYLRVPDAERTRREFPAA